MTPDRNEEIPVEDALVVAGFKSLSKTSPKSSIESALRELWESESGCGRLREATIREAVITKLKEAGIQAPMRMWDAALADRNEEQQAATFATEEELNPDELLTAGREILEAKEQLVLFQQSLRQQRYAGDTAAVELVHVAFCSRALKRPLGLALMGPSASGKTYTANAAIRHHPDDAAHDVSAMSERYLAYADFPTEHRYVFISEASALYHDGIGATIIRELAWNRVLRYGTVVKGDDGLEAVIIEKPGPTGLITTSTKDLDSEIATRLIAVHVTDSPDQTRAVVTELARDAAGEIEDDLDLSAWHAASNWLAVAGETRVIVPFAHAIAAAVPTDSVRMRRDFEQVMTVVRAVAFMHQLTRSRDDKGRIVATLEDYVVAYRLLAKTLAVTLDRVSDEMRDTVGAVHELNEAQELKGVSYPALAEKLGLSRSGAWRRVESAVKGGYLANAEERKGYPAKLVCADPLPDDRAVLPAPEDIHLADTPAKSTQQLNTSAEFSATTRKEGVERGVEPEEALSQPANPLNTSRNTGSSYRYAEKSADVEVLSETNRGALEGGLFGGVEEEEVEVDG